MRPLALFLFLSAPAAAAVDDIAIRPLTEGAWVVSQTFPAQANALVVAVGEDQLAIVDTLYRPRAMEELYLWAQHNLPNRRLFAINTHFHADRTGGNEYLLGKNVPIYASDRTHALMKERGREVIELVGKALDGGRAVAYGRLDPKPADGTFALKTGLTLKFGSDEVQVRFHGEGHSPDNVVVWFPAKKILFAGCLAVAADKLGNNSDAVVEDWKKTLAALKEYPAEFVIPGHGERTSPKLLANTEKVLAEQK